MSDALFAAMFQKFFELSNADTKYYTKSLQYARVICRLRKDERGIEELTNIENQVPPTSMDLYTLETTYYAMLGGQLNSKIKLDKQWFSTIDIGRILDTMRETILLIFCLSFFEEPTNFNIEQLGGAKQ